MKQLAYQNGQFIAANRAAISPHDAGFVWGATVTDRLRTFNGHLFRVDDHLCRFRESCRRAHILCTESDEKIVEISNELVTSNREKGWELSLIWLATPGVSSGFAIHADRRIPTFLAMTENLTPLKLRRQRDQVQRLCTSRTMTGVDPQVKHRSRLAYWIATQEVHELDPNAHPLLIDPISGHVRETPIANVLAVFDGVVTSPVVRSVLPGISLQVTRELCRTMDIPFVERDLKLDALFGASEVLLTNTSFSIAGVAQVDDCKYPHSGPMFLRLLDAWSNLVGVALREEMGGER